eukprot:s2338_g3.t2
MGSMNPKYILQALRVQVGCRSAQAASRLARCASGKIETFLVRGPVNESTLALASAPLAAHIDLSCLVFFCLGTKPETVASVAGGALGLHGMCPVYIADCYGIIGWDKKEKRNVELMEEGRGSEYGKPGGQGGEGVVVAAFRGGGHAAGDAGGVHMVVSSHGKAKLQAAKDGEGVSYGGYAKAVALDLAKGKKRKDSLVVLNGNQQKNLRTGRDEPPAQSPQPCARLFRTSTCDQELQRQTPWGTREIFTATLRLVSSVNE